MNYTVVAETDTGIFRDINEDSILVKHARCGKREVLMAVICDGMGGLSKGEVASAVVVRQFSKWFDEKISKGIDRLIPKEVGEEWKILLKKLNMNLIEYGHLKGIHLGTTFTGVLFWGNVYVIVHVGDSRMYSIMEGLNQMTSDHTLVAQEVRRGKLTADEAKTDQRRNILLQCIGASAEPKPEIITGTISPGVYFLCSDGFIHEITETELYSALKDSSLTDKEFMHQRCENLIDLVKKRQEGDNISIILIKVEDNR